MPRLFMRKWRFCSLKTFVVFFAIYAIFEGEVARSRPLHRDPVGVQSNSLSFCGVTDIGLTVQNKLKIKSNLTRFELPVFSC
jgi:hypothetical protein